MSPSRGELLDRANHRIRELEELLARRAELVKAATELGQAELEADRLIFRLSNGNPTDLFPVRHETIDRLGAAELAMRKAAKGMVEASKRDLPIRTGAQDGSCD